MISSNEDRQIPITIYKGTTWMEVKCRISSGR